MECLDSGMVLLKDDDASIASASPRNDIAPTFPIFGILGKVLNYAYGQIAPGAIPLLW